MKGEATLTTSNDEQKLAPTMSTILETHQDPNYEPSQTEIVEYGKWLGMELPGDEPLLWIAREGLKAPLPEHWKACKSEKGELYYFNFKTGQSIWDHPLDEHYKQLFKKEKENPSKKTLDARGGNRTPSPAVHEKKEEKKEKRSKEKEQDASAASLTLPVATAGSSKQLPPSGKTAPAKVEKMLPSLSATTASNQSNASSSEDEPSSGSQDNRRTGKLHALKTLKTKKDMPGELRIDSLAVPADEKPVLAPLESHNKVPLGSNLNKTPAHQQMPVETMERNSTAPKCSPISTINETASSLEPSPTVADVATNAKAKNAAAVAASLAAETQKQKQKTVSFSSDEVQLAQEGKKQQIQSELLMDLERYREDEANRMAKLKEEYVQSLDATLKKTKAHLKQRHEQQIANYELELKEEMQEKKNKCQKESEEELQQFRRQTKDSTTRKQRQLKEELEQLGDAVESTFEGIGNEIGKKLLAAVADEQRRFLQCVHEAITSDRSLIEAKHDEQLEILKSTLKSEQNMVAARIREIQGECNAKITVLKMENESALQQLKREFEETKQNIEAEHREDLCALIAQLKAKAEQELRGVTEEFSQRQNELKQQLRQEEPKPLGPLTGSSGGQPSTKSQSPPHAGLGDAIRIVENQSDSSDDSLVELAQSLNQATKSSLPAKSHGAPVAPLSENALSNSLSQHEDLRILITDVLRDLFKNSPFILPSPASQSHSAQVSPTSFGREINSNNVMPNGKYTPDPMHYAVGYPPTAASTYPPPSGHLQHQQVNTSFTPGSFQEQRKLLEDERKRLIEAKAFVENQRTSLEERRAQLKAAKKHWKSDVLAAKAQGIAATSKKGLLLQKVHKVLEKQAVGLQHDDNLLKDSEHWLRMKEQRLLKLEAQMEEQERSRTIGLDVSATSVDTTALLTGFFKPSPTSQQISERKEQQAPSAAAPLSVPPALKKDRAATPPARSISPVLSKALERIEKRLEKVASLVVANGPSSRSGSTSVDPPQHNPSTATAAQTNSKKRTSRSSSRTRHVDFAQHAFADPWAEIEVQ